MAKKLELTTIEATVSCIQDGVIVYFTEKGQYLRGIIVGASALVETCNHTSIEYTIKVSIDGKFTYHKMGRGKMFQTPNKMFEEDTTWDNYLTYEINRPTLYNVESIITNAGQLVKGKITKMYNDNIIQKCEFADWTITVRDENDNIHVGKLANMLKVLRPNSTLIKGDHFNY